LPLVASAVLPVSQRRPNLQWAAKNASPLHSLGKIPGKGCSGKFLGLPGFRKMYWVLKESASFVLDLPAPRGPPSGRGGGERQAGDKDDGKDCWTAASQPQGCRAAASDGKLGKWRRSPLCHSRGGTRREGAGRSSSQWRPRDCRGKRLRTWCENASPCEISLCPLKGCRFSRHCSRPHSPPPPPQHP